MAHCPPFDSPDHDPVLAALAGLGIQHEIVACDPALADTAEFCAHYGYSLDQSANAIVVKGKSEPPVFAMCLVLATTQADVNRTVRKRLGTKKASFASPDETIALTGMQIGGVTPFALPPGVPVWVDAAVTERDRVILGGGSRSIKVLCPPATLLALPDVVCVDGLATPIPKG